jgi:hypothetical protein
MAASQKSKNPPLVVAAEKGDLEVLQYLLTKEVDINARDWNSKIH